MDDEEFTGAETFAVQQVCEMTGTAARTLRKYTQMGILPSHPLGWVYVARVHAIRILREERGIRSLQVIKALLKGMTDEQVLDFVENDGEESGSTSTAGAQENPGELTAPPGWTLVALAPGLDLHIRADVTPETLELIAKIKTLAGV